MLGRWQVIHRAEKKRPTVAVKDADILFIYLLTGGGWLINAKQLSFVSCVSLPPQPDTLSPEECICRYMTFKGAYLCIYNDGMYMNHGGDTSTLKKR